MPEIVMIVTLMLLICYIRRTVSATCVCVYFFYFSGETFLP